MNCLAEEITFADFEKLDLRVGKIVEATPVPNSKKLIKIIVDFGSENRQAVAGLLKFISLKSWLAKNVFFF